MVHPVVRAIRVPSEVCGTPQQERPKTTPVHKIPEQILPGLAAHCAVISTSSLDSSPSSFTFIPRRIRASPLTGSSSIVVL